MTNTAVYLNELERKQTASLLCFLIIYYKQSIGENGRKGAWMSIEKKSTAQD